VEISDGISLRRVPACVDLVARSVAVNVGGHTQTFAVPSRSERWAAASAAAHSSARAVVAPFPATVAEVHVERGDTVRGGQPVVVVEAMKMLHTLAAAGDGVVAEVRVAAGEQVASAQVLVTFEDEDEQIGERPARSDSGDR
jgi:biotin carboxyl carrier protein